MSYNTRVERNVTLSDTVQSAGEMRVGIFVLVYTNRAIRILLRSRKFHLEMQILC